jgi:hypothetical protein
MRDPLKGGKLRKKITRTRLAVFVVAAAAALAVAVPAAFAGTTFIQGSLSPGDIQQTDRLFRDGIPSNCNVDKYAGGLYNPGLFGDATARAADVYDFFNATNQFQCVTVRLRTNCGPFDPALVNGFSAAYTAYDPAFPDGLQNPLFSTLIGDAGQSGSPMQYGFVVAPFETFQVVVATVGDVVVGPPDPFENCNSYQLTVQIGKTARVAGAVSKSLLRPGSYDKHRAS